MPENIKIFDMFSGIFGGFHLGLSRAIPNLECIGFSDIDKYAISVYQKHFPGVKNYGDATKINAEELPDFDILCGGFPCQSFSIAGKRQGFKDIRGTLFAEIVRIAKDKRPRLLFLENVKGLLNHDGGETFATILHSFSELGYSLEWEVLNSKNFGVPQNRERVFIVGHLGAEPECSVFPLGQDGEEPDRKGYTVSGDISTERSVSASLTARYYKMGRTDTYIKQLNSPKHSNNRVYGEDGISPSLNTAQGGNRQPKIQILPVLTPDRMIKRQNGRRMKEDGEPSFTLNAQDKHGVCLGGSKIRRLTPTECERLQGYPDGYTEFGKGGERISDTQRYKMLGNSVTVNVITEIGKRLVIE